MRPVDPSHTVVFPIESIHYLTRKAHSQKHLENHPRHGAVVWRFCFFSIIVKRRPLYRQQAAAPKDVFFSYVGYLPTTDVSCSVARHAYTHPRNPLLAFKPRWKVEAAYQYYSSAPNLIGDNISQLDSHTSPASKTTTHRVPLSGRTGMVRNLPANVFEKHT